MIDFRDEIYSSCHMPSHKSVGLRESISFGNDLLTINEMKKIIKTVQIENDIKQLISTNRNFCGPVCERNIASMSMILI